MLGVVEAAALRVAARAAARGGAPLGVGAPAEETEEAAGDAALHGEALGAFRHDAAAAAALVGTLGGVAHRDGAHWGEAQDVHHRGILAISFWNQLTSTSFFNIFRWHLIMALIMGFESLYNIF